MQTRNAPPHTRVEDVVDDYCGHAVIDLYRWLEDADSAETKSWVEAQNAYTRSMLDPLPCRDRIKERLTELMAIGMVGTPTPAGGRYFYRRREGAQNQPALYVRAGLHGEERTVFDPNAESAEGLVTLDWWFPSPDGTLLAYGVSREGNEWSTLHVLEVDTGRQLSDQLERTRMASVAWLPDNSGFYYTRYPLTHEVPEGEDFYHRKVFFHRLGDERDDDVEILGITLQPIDRPAVSMSGDGRWLMVKVVHDWARHDLYLLDRSKPDAQFVPIAAGEDAHFNAEIVDGMMYIHTNLDAAQYRLVRVDPEKPDRSSWVDVIPQRDDALLVKVTPAGGKLVAAYLKNAAAALELYSIEGEHRQSIPLPGIGTVGLWEPDLAAGVGVSGEWDAPHALFSFQSFAVPPAVYTLDTRSGETAIWMKAESPIAPEKYQVSQEWYTSRDGTRVPVFIVHRADLDLSSPHPTLLTGYGGFGYSYLPVLQRSALDWLERGGIFALPSLRGGGEFGTAWHRAGQRERKQNVFDDFIAAAEYLIERGYTERSKLAILGISNGGLLTGAVVTQRPDLFRTVVISVAALDMLRIHRIPPGHIWIPEFGSADDPDQYPALAAYSPYHNVRDGTSYPAILITTAEYDTRVNPLHSRKMAARLQAANASEQPILLRVERQGGHGLGAPWNKQVEEQTDIWSFISWQLGVDCSP